MTEYKTLKQLLATRWWSQLGWVSANEKLDVDGNG